MCSNNNSEIEVVTELAAEEVSLTCPYCSVKQSVFVSDPRGDTYKCESCEKLFKVHEDADIEFY